MPKKHHEEDLLHTGHVRLWHPWQDKPGIQYVPCMWDYSSHSLDSLISAVTQGRFVLLEDLLDVDNVPFANELIGHSAATPYFTRGGTLPAMRLHVGRASGFLVTASSWQWEDPPDKRLLSNLNFIFNLFGYQSSTSAGLSEKVLRSTLPEKFFISRPSQVLRRDILDNHVGGRIDGAIPHLYKHAYIYDEVKAYLNHSRETVSPYQVPVTCVAPCMDEVFSYPAGWWKCSVVAREHRIPPIQIKGGMGPVEGECFTRWLWTKELEDCLEAGYQVEVERGYGWRKMSTWMKAWSDILWEKYLKCKPCDPHLCEIIKSMMVGLPGRLLRKPEQFLLIPLKKETAQKGDIIVKLHWHTSNDRLYSDWAIRPVYAPESSALSHVGSYIVAEMRHELYQRMKAEEERGNHVIRSYVDNVMTEGPTTLPDTLGNERGNWRLDAQMADVYAEENRFVGRKIDPYGWEDEDVMKAPGYDKKMKIELWQKYRKMDYSV